MTEKKVKIKPNPEAIQRILKGMKVLQQQKEKELRIISAVVSRIKRECQHDIVKDNRCDTAECSICGSQFGWWCDESPVNHCEYEMGENCIHCGLPEERK